MPTFNNGESAASVRTKINDAIDKVDGASPITSADINGGTIDGTVIGGSTPAAISGTTGQFGTSLNVDGTITSDGLTVDSSVSTFQSLTGRASPTPTELRIASTDSGSDWSTTDPWGRLAFYSNDPSGGGVGTRVSLDSVYNSSGGHSANLQIKTYSFPDGLLLRQKIDNNGDISFYEDTGTTPKFFWDASAERLGIGTSSPAQSLHILAGAQGPIARFSGLTADRGLQIETVGIGTSGDAGIVFKNLRDADGTFIFQQANTERMRITSAGDVGIGTTSPIGATQAGSITASGVISAKGFLAAHQTAAGIIEYNSNITAIRAYGATAGTGVIAFNTGGGGDSTDAERMRITSSGNVGIGTSSPASGAAVARVMHIEGTTAGFRAVGTSGSVALEMYTGSAAAFLDTTTNHPFVFRTNNVERLRITSSGNVGIGTSSPNSKLTVYGGETQWGDTSGLGILSYTGGAPIVGSVGAIPLLFYTNSAERARIDASGNFLIGGTTAGTASAGNLVLVNGTAPTGNVTNGITLYAEDVSASSELKVRDEAGNVTTLSPHNFELIPEGPSEDMAWSYYSERDGKRINVDMLKAIRLLEQITGEKLVHMA
jgi:hypothetical protein